MVVPFETPVTTPVNEPIVAIAGALLLQVPPEVVLVSVVEEPIHRVVLPVIPPREVAVTVSVRTANALPQPFVTV
jgi:hypothetical protein